MVDIHCHIIFNVDDGSADIEESAEMASLAQSGGTDSIIATPHSNISGSYVNRWGSELENKIALINKTLEAKGFEIKVYPGQEIFCADNYLQLLRNGQLITLNNSQYPLVEFDFNEDAQSVYYKLNSLVSEGYVPIVAHPERYGFVYEDENSATRLKNMGCLLQVNKGSLKGNFGKRAYICAQRIINRYQVDFIASDAHSPYMRTPYLEEAYEYVSENYSFDYAQLIFDENPRAVLNNETVNFLY